MFEFMNKYKAGFLAITILSLINCYLLGIYDSKIAWSVVLILQTLMTFSASVSYQHFRR